MMKCLLLSYINVAYLIAIAAALLSSQCGADEGLPEQISFGQHIRPIFTAHCTACHGGVSQAGDVSFVYRQQVLPPDGWIVQPGKPEESVLLDRVTSDDPEIRMPPPDHGAALSRTEIALLEKWIRQGANWDEHWAFVAPTLAPPPELQDPAWVRQPLDSHVLSQLERLKIKPQADALPDRWLRRVTLDLIGLPPTLQERADFLEDLSSTVWLLLTR